MIARAVLTAVVVAVRRQSGALRAARAPAAVHAALGHYSIKRLSLISQSHLYFPKRTIKLTTRVHNISASGSLARTAQWAYRSGLFVLVYDVLVRTVNDSAESTGVVEL